MAGLKARVVAIAEAEHHFELPASAFPRLFNLHPRNGSPSEVNALNRDIGSWCDLDNPSDDDDVTPPHSLLDRRLVDALAGRAPSCREEDGDEERGPTHQ